MVAALSACDPAEVADKVGMRAADSVVGPVVSQSLPGAQASLATRCIVDNASAAEVQALARDVGVEAGTSTRATVAAIAARAETGSCLASRGIRLPPLR